MGFFDQMKQLKELQDKMEEAKKRLEAIEVDAANDYVKVTVTGNRKVKNIEIYKLDDKLTLEGKIQSAVNEAMAKAENVMQSEMMGAMPKIPGLNG